MIFHKTKLILFLGLFLAGFSGVLFFLSDFIVQATHDPGGSNIYGGPVDDPLDQLHWAWNDAIGWIDFHSANNIEDFDLNNPYVFNVIVKSNLIEGYASSSAKQLSLDCATSPDTQIGNICSTSNYRVLNDGCGALSGWAWSEVYGWASFCGTTVSPGSPDCPYNPNSSYGVVISSNGDFTGYAWSDVLGWISFNCDNTGGNYCTALNNHKVKTTWVPTSTSAYLDSSTFDTGVQGGAQLNSIMWLGDFTSSLSTCAGAASRVGFQIAATSAPNGPWDFIGPSGTSNDVYEANLSQPGVSIPLDYALHNNQRYFRYRVFLFSDESRSRSPRIDDIIINWSP